MLGSDQAGRCNQIGGLQAIAPGDAPGYLLWTELIVRSRRRLGSLGLALSPQFRAFTLCLLDHPSVWFYEDAGRAAPFLPAFRKGS